LQIVREGQAVHLRRRKVETLLAYLVLHPQEHSRDHLAPLSSFIGRKREMAEVKRLLVEQRLVTLTGAGGSLGTVAEEERDFAAARAAFEKAWPCAGNWRIGGALAGRSRTWGWLPCNREI
jgi:hypothetical protein